MLLSGSPKLDEGKYVYLDEEDIELIRSMPRGSRICFSSGIRKEDPASMLVISSGQSISKFSGVEGVGLYGGTKHTVATALGQLLSPEEIKRGGTGSKTNKAFDKKRACQCGNSN